MRAAVEDLVVREAAEVMPVDVYPLSETADLTITIC